ncbi:hypothetical protein ACLOJK_005546 [Asimina triloba]
MASERFTLIIEEVSKLEVHEKGWKGVSKRPLVLIKEEVPPKTVEELAKKKKSGYSLDRLLWQMKSRCRAKGVEEEAKVMCVALHLKLVAVEGEQAMLESKLRISQWNTSSDLDMAQTWVMVAKKRFMELESEFRHMLKAKEEGPSGSGAPMPVSTNVWNTMLGEYLSNAIGTERPWMSSR